MGQRGAAGAHDQGTDGPVPRAGAAVPGSTARRGACGECAAQIKQKDRLAVSKLVINQMQGSAGRSPYTCILLIRYACKVMAPLPHWVGDACRR